MSSSRRLTSWPANSAPAGPQSQAIARAGHSGGMCADQSSWLIGLIPDEVWGIPVVESLACGTPVCTSNSTAMPEAGGEHAVYFDPTDIDSIVSAATTTLHGETAFAKIRDSAIARARTFTWQQHASELIDLYQRTLTP